jgi:hypothetical protein
LGTKRIRLNDLPITKVADKAIPLMQGTTPLEAAMAAAATYVETLHKKLQPFLLDLIRQVLKDASTFHHKHEKLKEMRANPDYVPAVCCSIRMKLQAVSEVSKSQGFKTLEDKLEGEIQALRRNWATRFVLTVQDLSIRVMRKRFQLFFCWLLSKAAKVFVALERTGTTKTSPPWIYLLCTVTRSMHPSISAPTTYFFSSRRLLA